MRVVQRELFITCWVVCLTTASFAADNTGLTLTSIYGQVQTGQNQQSYQAASVGKSCPLGSWVKTSEDSSITVLTVGGNQFHLLSESEAEIKGDDGVGGGEWHRVISLKIGSVEVKHVEGPQKVKLECDTPTSVCGAEGTEFTVNASAGVFTVAQGKIEVHSKQENELTLKAVTSGGVLVYTPGSVDTWCNWTRNGGKGNFSGTVVLGSLKLEAVGADFTIAKSLAGTAETAIRIKAGKVGSYGPGMYVVDGSRLELIPAGSNQGVVFGKYLAAARVESALFVQKEALLAANREVPETLVQQLRQAQRDALKFRAQLFGQ